MKHPQSLLTLTGQAKNLVKGYVCNGQCYHQALADLKNTWQGRHHRQCIFRKTCIVSKPLNPARQKTFSILINDLVYTFTRLEYEHYLKSTMNTQVAIQKLPYNQLIDWSKHGAQNQMESSSLEQFAEWLFNCRNLRELRTLFPKQADQKRLNKSWTQSLIMGMPTLDMLKINFKVHQDTYPRKARVPSCSQFQLLIKNAVKIKDS